MEKYKLFIATLLFIGFFWSCTNDQESKYGQIKALEDEVFQMNILDKEKGIKLVDAYVDYAKAYPKDTATAAFLFKAGDLAMNMNMGSQAILYYNKVRTLFPDFEKAPESLFLKAFICENQLGDLNQAEKYYNEFIEAYPNHVLVKDAKASLLYLGKSPEELVKIFQEKNK